MKKYQTLLIIVAFLSILAYPIDAFQLKIDDNVPMNETCFKEYFSIPSYFNAYVPYINIHKYPYYHHYDGYAFLNSGIVLYDGCNRSILIHELAHICQNKVFHDKVWQMQQHRGNFTNCWEMIKNERK